MEHDRDDIIPVGCFSWSVWNRLYKGYSAWVFGLLPVLLVLGLPQPAKAQSVGYGIVCRTPEEIRRYVLADDPQSMAVINAEKTQSCELTKVSFYAGKVEGTIVTKDSVLKITHILIVGVATHGGFRQVKPTPGWIAIPVASEGA